MTKPQPAALLVFDVDGTLCRLVDISDLGLWTDEVLARHPAPLETAGVRVRALLELHQGARVVILTARSELLRECTSRWLAEYFPRLAKAELSMRADDDDSSSSSSKGSRLAALRLRWPGPLLLVDDDPLMRNACGAGDRFVLASGERWGLS